MKAFDSARFYLMCMKGGRSYIPGAVQSRYKDVTIEENVLAVKVQRYEVTRNNAGYSSTKNRQRGRDRE